MLGGLSKPKSRYLWIVFNVSLKNNSNSNFICVTLVLPCLVHRGVKTRLGVCTWTVALGKASKMRSLVGTRKPSWGYHVLSHPRMEGGPLLRHYVHGVYNPFLFTLPMSPLPPRTLVSSTRSKSFTLNTLYHWLKGIWRKPNCERIRRKFLSSALVWLFITSSAAKQRVSTPVSKNMLPGVGKWQDVS